MTEGWLDDCSLVLDVVEVVVLVVVLKLVVLVVVVEEQAAGRGTGLTLIRLVPEEQLFPCR